MIIDVQLFPDRNREGRLTIVTSERALWQTQGGQPLERYRCLGRSDSTAAKEHNNAIRNPLLPFGDIPTGTFNAVRTVPGASTLDELHTYGPGPRFVLNAVDGAALQALHNGRFGLLIHGGATGAPMPPGALRPTHGCIRVDDATTRAIDSEMTRHQITACPAYVRIVTALEDPAAVAARYQLGQAPAPAPAITT